MRFFTSARQPFKTVPFALGAENGYLLSQEQLSFLEQIGVTYSVRDTVIDGIQYVLFNDALMCTSPASWSGQHSGKVAWSDNTGSCWGILDGFIADLSPEYLVWWVPDSEVTNDYSVKIGTWRAYVDPRPYAEIIDKYYAYRFDKGVILKYSADARITTERKPMVECGLFRTNDGVMLDEIEGVTGPFFVKDHHNYSGYSIYSSRNRPIVLEHGTNTILLVDVTSHPNGILLFEKIFEVLDRSFRDTQKQMLRSKLLNYDRSLTERIRVYTQQMKDTEQQVQQLREQIFQLKTIRALSSNLYNEEFEDLSKELQSHPKIASWRMSEESILDCRTMPLVVEHSSGTRHYLGRFNIRININNASVTVCGNMVRDIPVCAEGCCTERMVSPRIRAGESHLIQDPAISEAIVDLLCTKRYVTALDLVIQDIEDCGEHEDRLIYWPQVDDEYIPDYNWNETKQKQPPFEGYKITYRLIDFFRRNVGISPPDGDCNCSRCECGKEAIKRLMEDFLIDPAGFENKLGSLVSSVLAKPINDVDITDMNNFAKYLDWLNVEMSVQLARGIANRLLPKQPPQEFPLRAPLIPPGYPLFEDE